MILAFKAATGGAEETVQAIIATNSGTVYSTKNGVTFTESASTGITTVAACGYFQNKWLAAGSSGAIRYSDDLLTTWTASTVGEATGTKRKFVSTASTALVAGSYTSSGNNRYSAEYSTAIATFTVQRADFSTANGYSLRGAATNGSGTWAVCGDNVSGTNFYSSTNLTVGWTNRTTGLGSSYGLAFGGSTWVVAGNGGALYTSTDLATWTSRTSQTGGSFIYSVAYGNSLFVLVADAGKISTSTDGITWTARTSGTANALNDVQWVPGLGLWLAVGDNGTILTSSDAITWTSRSTGAYSLRGIGVKP